MLSCEIVTSEADIQKLADPWHALQAERGLSPFTDFAWIWAWWISVGKPEGIRFFVVACWDGARLVGVLPFSVGVKYGVRILRYASHDASYMRNLLATGGDVVDALWETVRTCNLYDFADIKNVHKGTSEQAALDTFADAVDESPVYFREHSGLTRETVFKAYTKRFRRKLYKTIETIQEREAFTHGLIADASILEEAVPFLVAEKKAWCEKNGKTGLFDSARVEAFYRAVCQFGLQQGIFRLFWLRKNGKLCAVLLCFIYRDTLYVHTVAHDPSVRSVRPGLFLKAEAMIWAAETGLRETNFMEGREFFKVRFSSDARVTYEFTFARTLKGKLFALAYKLRHRLRKPSHEEEPV